MNIRDLFIFLGIVVLLGACSQDEEQSISTPTPFLHTDIETIDAKLANMSTSEKVGQLILAQSDLSDDSLNHDLLKMLATGKLGGLLLESVNLEQFIRFLDTAHHISDKPLFVATRQEVLLNNQFCDLLPLPSLASLQATANDSLQKNLIELYGRQANQLGVNLSFAANLDDTPATVVNLNTYKILAGVKGISAYHLLSKRDTSCRLNELILPFERFQQQGAAAFYLQDFRADCDLPISYQMLQHYFRKELGFQGLLIAHTKEAEEIKYQLQSGIDLFIVSSENVAFLHNSLLQQIKAGAIDSIALDDKVRRILMAKKWAKSRTELPKYRVTERPMVLQASFKPRHVNKMPVALLEEEALLRHFKDDKWDLLRYRIYEKSMVLLSNRNDILPLNSLKDWEFRMLHFSSTPMRTFEQYFKKYADFRSYNVGPDSPDVLALLRPPKTKNRITIITMDELSLSPGSDTLFIQALQNMAFRSRVVLVNFGAPEIVQGLDSMVTVLQVFERNEITESLAAQLLFGAVGASGKLPESINEHFRKGHGLETQTTRLKYGMPEEVGISPEKLVGIDAIVKTAIQENAMPGCQVLLAKDGNIVYSKAFGYHSFNKKREVKSSDLYDLASITKVAATTLATMQLYEQGVLNLEDRLYELLDWKGQSTIKYISLKKLLTHHSGLQSNMPIAPYIMYRDVPNAGCDSFFCNRYSDTFSIKVAENFYFDQRQIDKIWDKVHSLPVGSQRRYRYSDVNFVLLQKVVETMTKQGLDDQLEEAFYKPLGLRYNLFNPADRFKPEQIVPTQNDYRWRHQLLQGYVHDESAALLGGVAGNAGLFSNAEDLAIPFQMLLNKGKYGGKQFLQPETIDLFTKTHTSSRRGLGFYKPFQDSDYTPGPSAQTFGHTGFTGTAVWADPEQNLLYIFLSNRIHPSVSNKAFSRSRVRQRVQQVIYDALNTYEFVMPELPLTPEEGEGIRG